MEPWMKTQTPTTLSISHQKWRDFPFGGQKVWQTKEGTVSRKKI